MSSKRKPVIVQNYALTAITKDGGQHPIAPDAFPGPYVFQDWTRALDALKHAVDDLGLENVHAVAKIWTHVRGGELADYTITHYSQNEVREMIERATGEYYVKRSDGGLVRVTVPA